MLTSSYPTRRMRRNRTKLFLRRLTQESQITPTDLILPVFVRDVANGSDPIKSMPGMEVHGFSSLLRQAQLAHELGIPALALFPQIEPNLKTSNGDHACDPEGLIPRAIQKIKTELPEMGVIADIALDPYTTHGHDGVLDESGDVANDATIEVLAKQAICFAQAGCDMVAPSDMMDGRIGRIRNALDEKNCSSTAILSYAVKFVSAFYGPFRDAVGTRTANTELSKVTYQINSANKREALEECALDVQEGADAIMIKPGLPYLDVVSEAAKLSPVPVFSFQVSGEYAMIKFAAQSGAIAEQNAILESLNCLKRAGSRGIISYFAIEAAKCLQNQRTW